MGEQAYTYLPIGTAYCTGKSEEDAIEKFVAEREDVEREQIVGCTPQSRKVGIYMIHYSRPGVTQLDLLGYTEVGNNCIECGEYIEIHAQGQHRKFCGPKCKMRYHRARKREQDIGRAREEGPT